MKLSVKGQLQRAVHTAFAASAACLYLATGAAQAQDTTPTAGTNDSDAVELQTYTVTGSRLRQVDTETASPVYTIDRATIESTGVSTLGELVQRSPSISGAATSPQVNNGGGTGAATVSLRGLGSERTLILLDGRRLGPSFDINSIPINLIERVEILKQGASAVYGSDAVGGVVNFITRKDYVGADLAAQFGATSEGDGQNASIEATWGISSEKGHLSVGLNYNKVKEVSAADRAFSQYALYVYNYTGSDTVIQLGSSRTPYGRVFLPDTDPAEPGFQNAYNCSSVTLAGGTGQSLGDYRCYDSTKDAYDYQPYNLIQTPQERGSIFASASYNLSDNVELFADVFHNFTQSGFALAALPFDANSDGVVISADSIYNPFGVQFGGGGNQFLTRFTNLGERTSDVETTTDQITAGLRGSFGQSSWTWDLAMTYQRLDQWASVDGYVQQTALQNAVGPSFIDPATGEPTCGSPSAPIPNCTPINIFNLSDPTTTAELSQISSGYENQTVNTNKIVEGFFSGNLFTWSQGTVQGGFGLTYRTEDLTDDVDSLTEAAPPDYSTCALSSETCSGDTNGQDNLWEAYGELYVPLLSDKPFAQTLAATLGVRYSDYESFGDTTNASAKLEWRPINDLLLRGTWAEVFRAPSIFDRYGATASTADLFADPCRGLTAADLAANPNYALACENVPLDGSFESENSQVTGLLTSNEDLDPETGHVVTGGFVYDPSFIRGLSINVDYWHYKLDDAITTVDSNVVAATCLETGDPAFCGLIERRGSGQVQSITLPSVNSASFETDGFDVGVHYRLPRTAAGQFMIGADASHTNSFEYSLSEFSETVDAAGTYDSVFGNFADWRATAQASWTLDGMEASWTTRYIDSLEIAASYGDGSGRPAADGPIKIGSVTYHDVTLGYTHPKSNTRILIGAENVFDKQPPLFYQYALNANTDVRTYDTLGRQLFVRISQSFQ